MAQAFEARGRNGRDFKHHTDEVITDFNELRRDLSKLAIALGKVAQSQVHSASDRFQHLSHDARDRALDGANVVSGKVREKPLSSVGASLGVGVIIGLALAGFARR